MSNQQLFLPDTYQPHIETEYFGDTLSIRTDTVCQPDIDPPEIYPTAELLLAGTGRSRLVDVGCGIGKKLAASSAPAKLGIDIGANIAHCRMAYPDAAEWMELDLGHPVPPHLAEAIGPQDVVVCSNVIEHIPDPRPLLAFLSQCFRRGALVITSTPDRVLVPGPDHLGPPPNRAHVREWTLAEYRALLGAHGLPPLYIGLTLNNDAHRLPRTIVSLHEPRLQHAYAPPALRPLAIMSCFNEEDVLEEVIEHWIAQGCDLHVLDNWSTDQSWPILQAAAARYGRHLTLERFPAQRPVSGSWHDILTHKEEIALAHKGRWIIHTDADEIRQSPFPPFSMADALNMAAMGGWNRVDFTVLNYRPTDERAFLPGSLATSLPHFEFGTKPGHFIQKKAWLQGETRVQLAPSGGHIADWADARDCPYRFVLHHYPLRSAAHARRKINHERDGRWSAEERQMGWHSHYADLAGEAPLTWDAAGLHDARVDFWARHGLPIITGLRRPAP